jgi:hypothetical protein
MLGTAGFEQTDVWASFGHFCRGMQRVKVCENGGLSESTEVEIAARSRI